MTINGITSTTTSATTAVDRTDRRQRMDKVFAAVADKLGMSKDDLMGQLRSGKSLTEVAQDKGLSKDDLLATIKDALGTGAPDDAALRIADHKGGHHGHHGPPPTPPADATTKAGASLNDLLGTNLDTEL